MKDVTGKLVVITGAGSRNGIGFATGTLLARHGARVVLADIDGDAAQQRAEELAAAGHEAAGMQVDVADLASMHTLAKEVADRHGPVHLAFLNAGVGGGNSLLDAEMASWTRVLGVNFLGVLHGIKAFVPGMLEHGEHGHVIATGSVAGVTGAMYTAAAYSVSKQAVWGLMECLHGQLRDAGADIRATLLLPPLVRTNLGGSPDAMEEAGRRLEAAGVPTELAEPSEVAALVLESLRGCSFWAHMTYDQDERLGAGRFARVIEWEDDMARRRARGVVDRSEPDSYLWGTNPRA